MGSVNLEPYIFFNGDCREAMEFYKSVFGGELFFQDMSDVPGGAPKMEGVTDNMVMHASLKGGEVALMASDSPKASPQAKKVTLSLAGTDDPKMRQIFDALADGGKVTTPLRKEFWGDIFGSFTDKFGVDWMMNISAKSE